MLQDYRTISAELRQGKFTMAGTWEEHGPLLIQNGGGTILIGDVQFQGPVRLQVTDGGHIEIGDYSSVNYGVEIHSKVRVTLGRYLLIGWGTSILDTDYHGVGYNPPKSAPVTVEDGVWIGNGCTVLKGVTIGRGALVAAGSVVLKDVPPFTIVSGNPARVVKEIEPFEGKHGQIFEYKWWDPTFVPRPKPPRQPVPVPVSTVAPEVAAAPPRHTETAPLSAPGD